MKTHQPLFAAIFVTFLGAMVAGWPAQAAQTSSLTIPLAGAAAGLPAGVSTALEAVDLTGQARITTTAIPSDPTTPPTGDALAPPTVVVDIEILSATGKGRTSKQAFHSRGLDRSILTLPLAPIVTAEADAIIFPASHATLADRAKVNHTAAHVAFTLNFDSTGKLTGATASRIATP